LIKINARCSQNTGKPLLLNNFRAIAAVIQQSPDDSKGRTNEESLRPELGFRESFWYTF